jgi:hypothetical protein
MVTSCSLARGGAAGGAARGADASAARGLGAGSGLDLVGKSGANPRVGVGCHVAGADDPGAPAFFAHAASTTLASTRAMCFMAALPRPS